MGREVLTKDQAVALAKDLSQNRYSDASAVFLAGSIVRGDGTPYSDLDLVVLFEKLPNARRESFLFCDVPVEAFIHDPGTLRYFFDEVDARSGVPTLPQMVAEAVPIPHESDLTRYWQKEAQTLLDAGPPPLTNDELNRRRYFITDIVDDLRHLRGRREAVASGLELYRQLADFWFRSQGRWSARGKMIPRQMEKADALFADRFETAFSRLLQKGEASSVVEIAREVLTPAGGFMFDGFSEDAKADWRK